VQATLLNPQGTVVRMFFVSYDFRDMPAMSQTFIRQRVLAIDEHISQKNVEQMDTSEQMKHLRYVINLRYNLIKFNILKILKKIFIDFKRVALDAFVSTLTSSW
jgi:hypothetical protein